MQTVSETADVPDCITDQVFLGMKGIVIHWSDPISLVP
jgi:hypothetical protein